MISVGKNKEGYGYKYTDISKINEVLAHEGWDYYQFVDVVDGEDYIMTTKIDMESGATETVRGCRVVNASLQGVKNPAQEQGSALTYARRYSLLMAFGMATEDNDASNKSNIIKFISKKTSKNEQAQMVISNFCESENIKTLETATSEQVTGLYFILKFGGYFNG